MERAGDYWRVNATNRMNAHKEMRSEKTRSPLLLGRRGNLTNIPSSLSTLILSEN